MKPTKRRICWPDFDATCLEGGCIYCNDYKMRSINSIYKAAESKGTLSNRHGGKVQNALEAFKWGETHGWCDAETQ